MTQVAEPNAKPDKIVSDGDWELRIYYTAKGTRSEGIRGALRKNGQLVPAPSEEHEILKTPLGRLKFYVHLSAWSPWGWLPEDLSPLRPSSKIK